MIYILKFRESNLHIQRTGLYTTHICFLFDFIVGIMENFQHSVVLFGEDLHDPRGIVEVVIIKGIQVKCCDLPVEDEKKFQNVIYK